MIGTARSAWTVSHAVDPQVAHGSSTPRASAKSTTQATSASAKPGASGLRSAATTRSPSSFARRMTAPLVAAGADDEDGLHRAAGYRPGVEWQREVRRAQKSRPSAEAARSSAYA